MEPEISVVIPTYNEQDNIDALSRELADQLKEYGRSYEIIFIDDGSTDGTLAKLIELHKENHRIKIIQFRRNFGQTAALDAGFKHAKGEIIVPMDADMQNDPADIPKMIAALKDDIDVVVGWRKHRRDPFSKRFISKGANIVRSKLIGEKIHDSGCTLKVIRREVLEDLDLFGEMHRFMPAIFMWKGFRVSEMIVHHRQRHAGKTKYNIMRVMRGFLDVLVVKFWMQYSTRPIQLFGGIGLFLGALGGITGIYLLVLKFIFNESIGGRPLISLAVLLLVLGVQFILFGFIADILVNMHYRGRPPYNIRRIY